ncbi:MAG: DDE-type integrase/transposase/recombinase [Cytophagales bacterium]|nr:DDE-type integrase/transposase/recombinase [Rhizobacter sp.]
MPDTLRAQPAAQAIALFRYGLIAELTHLPVGHPGLYALLRQKADQDYTIPGSTRCRVAPETLRHWLKAWRRGGFDALLPKPRADIGRSRALPQAVADALLTLKEEQPHLSIPQLITAIAGSHNAAALGSKSPPEIDMPTHTATNTTSAPLAASTVHRLLSRAGLIGKNAHKTAPTDEGRRRFAFDHPGQLWMSDVMHGPSVLMPDSRVRRKTYLIAFLDDATRLVPYCAFCLSENTQAFLPVFKQALLRRGIPQRLYVDNGANYRSHQLALVCARLGVALIHARPYQPQGKGKQERWFRTVRAQLLPTLSDFDTASLDNLNRRLWAWVEGEYHHNPHRGLDAQSPLERWAMSSVTGAAPLRLPGPGLDLDTMFQVEARRRVQRDHTVSLNGTLFEIDAALVGHTVTLRYDPSVPVSRGVEVWSEGKFIEHARVLDAYANCFVRRNHDSKNIQPTSAATPRSSSMNLRDLHELRPGSTDINSSNKEPR